MFLRMNDKISSVVTPVQWMKGFEKIYLEPGETKRVTIVVPFEEFSLWNQEMKYVVEPGEFEISIGTSAQDIKLKETITY